MRVALLSGLAWLTASFLAADRIDIVFLEPSGMEAVFGETRVGIEVRSPEPIREVVLKVDGHDCGALSEPPFQFLVDVGQQNVAHTFLVSVVSVSGALVTSTLTTPMIHIDEEVDLELQQIYTTVLGRNGDRVLDLEKEAFEIIDNGTRQQLVTFERGDIPFTAVLLIDASESMRGERIRNAKAGARAFIAGMGEYDEAKLMVFSDVLLGVSPFRDERETLGSALDWIGQGGGSAIHDYLFVAHGELEERQGRRVVILLSDGEDIHSVLRMSQVLEVARRSQVQVYWVRLEEAHASFPRGDGLHSWRDPAAARRELKLIEKLVRRSGGRIVPIRQAEEIEPAFRDVLQELRGQYVLGYYPEPPPAAQIWRRVRVRLQGAGGARARVQEDYYHP